MIVFSHSFVYGHLGGSQCCMDTDVQVSLWHAGWGPSVNHPPTEWVGHSEDPFAVLMRTLPADVHSGWPSLHISSSLEGFLSVCPFLLFSILLTFYYFLMCVGVLPAWIFVSPAHIVVSLGARKPYTGVTDGFSLPCGWTLLIWKRSQCWLLNHPSSSPCWFCSDGHMTWVRRDGHFSDESEYFWSLNFILLR